MSEVAEKKAEFLTDENYWLQEYMDDMLQWFAGESVDTVSGMTIPRMGVYSLLARSSPSYVYDNPQLMQEIAPTAFTDGVYTYYCVDFLKQCIKEDQDKGTHNVVFLMLHEYTHTLLRHSFRAMDFPNETRNDGFDLFINPMLQLAFPEYKPGKVLTEYGWGFKKGDERYAKMAEEDIIRELYDELLKQIQQAQKAQKGQQSQAGQGQPQAGQGQPSPNQGQSQPGQGQPQQGKGQPQSGQGQPQPGQEQPGQGQPQSGQGQPGQGQSQPGQQGQQPAGGQPGTGSAGKPGQKPGEGPGNAPANANNHVLTPDDMAKALERAGLGSVTDKLGLPKPGDPNADKVRQQLNEAMEAAIVDAAGRISDLEARGARMPGAHVNQVLAQMISNLTKPKMTWQIPVRNMIAGAGLRTTRMAEMAHRNVSALYQQGHRVWLSATVPAKSDMTVVEVVDTSGSMTEADLREALSESIGFIKQAGPKAARVLLFFTDTTLRGEAFVLTARNVDEVIRKGVAVLGRGGTNLVNNVNEVMDHKLVKEAVRKKQLAGVVLFSDLGDAPMLKEEMHKDLPRNFTIVATSGNYSDTWANASTAGRTFPLENKPKVDLTRKMTF